MEYAQILSFLCRIPRGRVVSYGYLAHRFSVHPRTIASVLSKNQDIDIYPCYKVVHTDGNIGGYNQWVEEKIRRLESDGIQIEKGRVDRRFFWEEEKGE